MFEGQVDYSIRNSLLYDDVKRHYHVIKNIKCSKAKNYVCKACKMLAQLTPHTPATRRVATVWRERHAPSPPYEFPAVDATDVLGTTRVSSTTSRKCPFVNACYVAIHVDLM